MLKNSFKLPTLVALFLMMGFFLSSCQKDEHNTPSKVSIYQIVKEDASNFSFLRAAIDKAGLKEQLEAAGDFTLFAPINQAFKDAGYANVAAVTAENATVLANILNYHVVDHLVRTKDVTANQSVNSINGKALILDIYKFTTKDTSYNLKLVNGVEIISKDVAATNGNMQVVNRILIPQGADVLTVLKANNNYSLFVAAINRASQGTTNFNALLSGTNNYTVFAPINSAFNAYLSGKYNSVTKINTIDPDVIANELVAYHIITGKNLTFQLPSKPIALNQSVIAVSLSRTSNVNNSNFGVRVVVNGIALNNYGANQLASNGVINELTSVLLIPSSATLLQTIQANSSLTFFKAMLDRASTGTTNFNTILSGNVSLTIFAPSNTALQAEGYNTLQTIALASPETLGNLISNHLFTGEIYSTSNPPGSNYSSTSINNLIVNFTNGATYTAQGPNNLSLGTISPANNVTANGVFNIINIVLK